MSSRRWLNVVTSQLEQVDQLLADDEDPVELTADGEISYRYLARLRDNLRRGSTGVLEEAVRRSLDILSGEHRTWRAYIRRSNHPDVDQNSYQEVADNTQVPEGPPTAPSSDAGGSRPHSPGYVYLPAHSRNHADLDTSPQPGSYRIGEVSTMYLIWDGQIVDADGDPAEVVMYASGSM